MTNWINFITPKETFSSKDQFEWIKLVCEDWNAMWVKSQNHKTEFWSGEG